MLHFRMSTFASYSCFPFILFVLISYIDFSFPMILSINRFALGDTYIIYRYTTIIHSAWALFNSSVGYLRQSYKRGRNYSAIQTTH